MKLSFLKIGIVPYASTPLPGSLFNSTDLDDVIEAIENLKAKEPSRLNTGKAIVYALKQFNLLGRQNANWYLYLITDGRAKVNLV